MNRSRRETEIVDSMQDFAGGMRGSLSNGSSLPLAETGFSGRTANSIERRHVRPTQVETSVNDSKDDKAMAFSAVWAAMAAGGGGINAAGLVSGGRMIAPDEMFEAKAGSTQTSGESGAAEGRNVGATKVEGPKRFNEETMRSTYKSGDDRRSAGARPVQLGTHEPSGREHFQDTWKDEESRLSGDKNGAQRLAIQQDSRPTLFNGHLQNTEQSESAFGKNSIETTGLARVMPELSVNQAARGASTKSSGGSSARVAEQVGRFLAQTQDSGLLNPRSEKVVAKGAERGKGKDESSAASNSHFATDEPSSTKAEEKVNDFERLVATMRLRLGARRSTARLELHPPELGRMSVDVRMDQKAVNIDVRTESEAAKNLVSGRANDLALALERHGIRVARLDVSISDTQHLQLKAGGSRARVGSRSEGVGNRGLKSDSRVDSQSGRGKREIEHGEESWLELRQGSRMDLVA